MFDSGPLHHCQSSLWMCLKLTHWKRGAVFHGQLSFHIPETESFPFAEIVHIHGSQRMFPLTGPRPNNLVPGSSA